jgi:hypothetical protein
MSQARLVTATLCRSEPLPERFRLHVEGASALAVDLDHREPFAVAGLERGVAVDRHLVELERELVTELVQPTPRLLAEVAAARLVERYARPTDKGPA